MRCGITDLYSEFMFDFIRSQKLQSQRYDSAFKSTCCPCRGPGFISLLSHGKHNHL